MKDTIEDVHSLPPGVEKVPVPEAEGACFRLRRGNRPRWPAPLRWLTISLSIFAGLGICVMLVAVVFIARLEKGPILVDGLGQRIAERLQKRFGAGEVFRLGDTHIEKGINGPQLTINSFSVSDVNGDVILAAPKARVTLDPMALIFGDVTPRRLDIVGLELRLSVLADGAFAISAGKNPILLSAVRPADGAETAKSADDQPSSLLPSGGNTLNPAAAENSADAPPAPNAQSAQEKSSREAVRPAADMLRQLLHLATGEGSPLGALGQFGILDGKLIFSDAKSGAETIFDGLQMQFERSPAQAKLLLSVIGPNGRWQMAVAAANEDRTEAVPMRTLDVDFSNLSLDEITLFAGLRELPFDTDMPIHLNFRIGAKPDGEFRMAQGNFGLGAGYFSFRDPDQEPFLFDRVSGTFLWDDDARSFKIGPARVESGDTKFLIGGDLLPPKSNNGLWSIRLKNIGDSQIAGERPGDTTLAISSFTFAADIDPADRALHVERFAVRGPQVQLDGQADFHVTSEGRRFKMNTTAGRMPVFALLRLWPSASGASVRAWLLQNLKSGTLAKGSLELDYDEEAFAAVRARRALPEAALTLDFELLDGVVTYLPGAPAARSVAASGKVSGKSSRITLTGGHIDANGKQVAISGGSLTATNMSPEASPASLNISLAAQADALVTVLNEPGLKQHVAMNLDPSTLKGRVEGKLTVDFKVGQKANPADTRIRAQANATNASIEHLMGKERLEAANIQFNIDGKDFSATGAGRMFGSPANFSFEKAAKGELNAVMTVTLDDQARQKMGWSTGARLSGPVAMKISGPLGGKETLQGNVEFDLTRASIAEIAPGLAKPAGRPAKATFTLAHRNDSTLLQNFNYQAGSTLARGTVELDKKGAFVSANLASLKLSPGDELSGEIGASGGNLRVSLHGSAIDVRPFIQSVTSSRAAGDEAAVDSNGRLDVDVQTKLATGYNRQALADFSLKMTRQGGRYQRFDLSSRAGRAAVRGQLIPGTSRVEVTAGDGGAVMSFLDLYRRMEGGQLSLSAQVTNSRIEGVLNVQNFTLRDEPALRRLVAEGAPRTEGEAKVRIDPSLVNFERLRLHFTKDQGRIQLHDGVISGPSIGTTLEGFVDFPRDQVNMKGTFVPAYGLNNMFAKIPLFGPILGGGRNEGLVGVNYSVTGKASAPVLNVNPLSAIAPGFLRKIFGAIGSIEPVESAPQARRPQMPLSLSPGPQQ